MVLQLRKLNLLREVFGTSAKMAYIPDGGIVVSVQWSENDGYN